MAKPSRRARDRMRGAEIAGSSSPSGTPPGRGSAGRRDRRPSYRQRSFIDRFGGVILMGFAAIGIIALGFVFLQSSSQRTYACDSLLTPGPTDPIPTATPAPTAIPSPTPTPTPSPTPTLAPGQTPTAAPSPTASPSPSPTAEPSPTTAPTPTPAPTPTLAPGQTAGPTPSPEPTTSPEPTPTPVPAPTQRLGFVVSDLGRNHIVDQTAKVDYAYCPPAGGPHWNVSRVAPVPRAFYQPEQAVVPQQWLHNVEHGFVIQLYSCGADGRSCPSADDMAKLKRVFDETPTTQGATACGVPNKLVVARFDDLSTRFALVAWDRELLTDTLDVEQAKTFAEQWIDGPATPEAGACF